MTDRTLRCRIADDSDHEAILALWREHSGWGDLVGTAWSEVVESGPWGEPTVLLTEETATGRLVGQLVFHRVPLFVLGVEKVAARPFGLVIVKDRRGSDLAGAATRAHPLRQLLEAASPLLASRGFDLVCGLPDPRLARVVAAFPDLQVSLLHFPLYSFDFENIRAMPPCSGFTIRDPCEPEDLSDLCQQGVMGRSFFVRTPRSLAWRVRVTGLRLVGVERAGRLVGVAGARHHGDRQWQIEDVLALDLDAAMTAVRAAVEVGWRAREAQSPDQRYVKAAILATPRLSTALAGLGFRSDDYQFSLLVAPVRELPTGVTDPNQWYAAAGD